MSNSTSTLYPLFQSFSLIELCWGRYCNVNYALSLVLQLILVSALLADDFDMYVVGEVTHAGLLYNHLDVTSDTCLNMQVITTVTSVYLCLIAQRGILYTLHYITLASFNSLSNAVAIPVIPCISFTRPAETLHYILLSCD